MRTQQACFGVGRRRVDSPEVTPDLGLPISARLCNGGGLRDCHSSQCLYAMALHVCRTPLCGRRRWHTRPTIVGAKRHHRADHARHRLALSGSTEAVTNFNSPSLPSPRHRAGLTRVHSHRPRSSGFSVGHPELLFRTCMGKGFSQEFRGISVGPSPGVTGWCLRAWSCAYKNRVSLRAPAHVCVSVCECARAPWSVFAGILVRLRVRWRARVSTHTPLLTVARLASCRPASTRC